MTFEEWWENEEAGRPVLYTMQDYRRCWDAALAAERARCVKVIWEYRGCCVSDASAKALMEHVMLEHTRGTP